ncbi:MAG: glycosyltransferase family 4 protein [Sulfurimonas sp.]|nr:glycosyltransferase family 4 protein [Sulfurimonas sp.]
MIYIILFIVSFLLTYLIKNYAIKKSILAHINERSSHAVPTPHGGGIAIAVSWFVGLFCLYSVNQIEPNLFYALLFGVVISLVGLFDDIYELSPKLRLMIHALVAFGGLYSLGGFHALTFGVFEIQNIVATNLFAFFMIIWFVNLYNFLDGINGYAGSEAIFLSFAGFLLFGGDHFLVLSVAVLGFLVWNIHNAKIFMGDVGSTLLGYNVAIFTIFYANHEALDFWVWMVLFGLFWFDATLTLIRRKINGEKLSQAHRKHAYQRLVQAGWSHTKVVCYAMGLNILLFCIFYFTQSILFSFSMMLLLLYSVIKFVDKKKNFL